MKPAQKRDSTVNKVDRSWRSKEHFDIIGGDTEFAVSPAGFQSYLSSAFPHCALFPMLWNGNVYSVSLYVGSL